jgi:hypothetical protein
MNPVELVAELNRILPGFADYLESSDNPFDSDNQCGVFAACSHFVRERTVAVESWRGLGSFLNLQVAEPDGAMVEAACSCFLENLADSRHPLKPFLAGEALLFWEQWEAAG